MAANAFRLITLGRLALLAPDGSEDPIGKRRRKLALLSVLALSKRPVSRDYLIEMFWGDQEEARARHRLSDALSHVRSVLGAAAVAGRQTEIAIARGVALSVDALELADAVAADDWERAIGLYGGPFLDGVYVEGSTSFEEWRDRERARLADLFVRACERESLRLARARRWEECATVARRWLDAAPTSGNAALYLMNALKAPGTREADHRALAAYDQLRATLTRDYGIAPERAVAQLADELADRVAEAGRHDSAPRVPTIRTPVEPAPIAASAIAPPLTPPASPTAEGRSPSRPAPPRRARWIAAGLAVVIAAAGGGAWLARWRTSRDTRPPGRVVIAVASISGTAADTGVAALAPVLPQMISADLDRSGAVEVVDPARIRDVRARQSPAGGEPTLTELLDVGGRVGATAVASGTLTRLNADLVLDLSVHEVPSGVLLRLVTVSNRDPVALVDEAAAQLLDAANVHGTGPRFAEVETSNLDAYRHYTRAAELRSAGRAREERAELDAAIALDSGYVPALRERLDGAMADHDAPLERRLRDLLDRHRDRASARDRIEQEIVAARMAGDRDRAVSLGRALVARYPRDPRAYDPLFQTLNGYSRWREAEEVLRQQVALDSLAAEAGSGPCAPCSAYGLLTGLRVTEGDFVGAERSARRLVTLQPQLPNAWYDLAAVYSFTQRFDSALAAVRHGMALSPEPFLKEDYARILIMARRYEAADSAIAELRASRDRAAQLAARDLTITLLRERGQLRASLRAIDSVVAAEPGSTDLVLLRGGALARLGDDAGAARAYEPHAPLPPLRDVDAGLARWFAWHHALLADAVGERADTAYLRALADSIAQYSQRSYYSRDWNLHHHVRGLIAMRAGRPAEAAREFQQARYGVSGWTASVVWLGRALLALGQPRAAADTLRHAYEAPLDAMGRYVPRSEVDYWMAVSFAAAHMADSAAVYRAEVERAWTSADPEVRRRLEAIGR